MKTRKIHKKKFHSGFFRFIFLLLFKFILSESIIAQVVVDTFNLPSGYTTPQLRFKNTLKVDPSNNVWIGFQRIGAGRFDGTNWLVYDTLNGLPSNNVLSFAFQGNDSWIGTDKGLAKLNGTSFTIYDSSNSGLTTNYILSLFTTGNNLLIGTRNGAFVFDGTTWIHYTTSNSGLPSDTVQCFSKSGNDTIWIGTANGLAKYYNNSWVTYYLPNSINTSNNSISGLAIDLNNNVWLESIVGTTLSRRISILRMDSVYSISNFYQLCYSVPSQGALLGLNTYGTISVAFNPQVFDLDIDPISASKSNVPVSLNSVNRYKDLDTFGKIWYVNSLISNASFLFSIEYHSSLQTVNPINNCYTLDANKVQARIWNNGCMFSDLSGNAQYEVPKGSASNSIFADAFWIGGLDASNQLHLAAQTYRQNGSDFWPGPLDTTNATIDSATVQQYDAIWKVDRYVINEFISEFAAGNVTNGSYPIPDVIMNWPAHGSGNYSRNLAPFIDYNLDGIYNPVNGDYPDIKGDQMLWFVYNDNYRPHGETGGLPLGIEVQGSAYAYSCPNVPDSEEVINFTTFYHYRIINRSNTNYSQVYMARFTDSDLGNYLDDYVGCDTTLNIAYTYNGDNYDEGISGYGSNPPMQNLLYLSDTMTHFTYYNNDGSVIGNPNSAIDYYNYMQSLWRNGNHITYGGNGNGSGVGATTIPTNYMFSSNPYDPSLPSWNETIASNSPDDRRFLTSTGPFDFPAHSVKEIDYAYVWSRDANYPNGLTTSWAKNVIDVLKIKQWFALGSFPCNNIATGIQETESSALHFNLYPNPAQQQLTLFISSKLNTSYRMEITDVAGRMIRRGIIFPNVNQPVKLEGIAPGIYFVRVSDKMDSEVKRFIRQ